MGAPFSDRPPVTDPRYVFSPAVTPLFLILGILAWGYPEESLQVFELYVGAMILKAMLRARWPLGY